MLKIHTNTNEKIKQQFKKIFIGFMAGVISGLFTAGGGLILVPAFMYMLKIESKKGKGNFYFLHIANGNYNSLFLLKKQFD